MKTTSLVKPIYQHSFPSTSAKCTICNGDKNKFIGFLHSPKFIGYEKEYKIYSRNVITILFCLIDLTEKSGVICIRKVISRDNDKMVEK